MRVTGAVPRDETLTLRIARDLRLDNWQPGGFLLKDVKSERGPLEMTLSGGGLDAGESSRPSAALQPQAPSIGCARWCGGS